MTKEAAAVAPRERAPADQAWARWLGRSIDALLLVGLSYGVWYAVGFYWQSATILRLLDATSLQWALTPTLQAAIANSAMYLALLLLIEPFFIGIAGTTPGKWLMGIRVVRADGRNLGYVGAFGRSLMVVTLGLALTIPIADFVAMLLQFFRVSSGQKAAWDVILDARVIHTSRPPLLWVALIASVIGVRIALNWEEYSARLSQ